jgi:hypothetical protein
MRQWWSGLAVGVLPASLYAPERHRTEVVTQAALTSSAKTGVRGGVDRQPVPGRRCGVLDVVGAAKSSAPGGYRRG